MMSRKKKINGKSKRRDEVEWASGDEELRFTATAFLFGLVN
jgi:hypothetical protein